MSKRTYTDKKKSLYKPLPGDLVFAKVKGYPAWPARVSFSKVPLCLIDLNSKLNESFFVFRLPIRSKSSLRKESNPVPAAFRSTFSGRTNRKYISNSILLNPFLIKCFLNLLSSAMISLNDLFPYVEYKDSLGKAKKHRNFIKGLEEIEAELQHSTSDLKEIASNSNIASSESNDSAMELDEDISDKNLTPAKDEPQDKSEFEETVIVSDQSESLVFEIKADDSKSENIETRSASDRLSVEKPLEKSVENAKDPQVLAMLSEEGQSMDSQTSEEPSLMNDEKNQKKTKLKTLNGRARSLQADQSIPANNDKRPSRKRPFVDLTPAQVQVEFSVEQKTPVERSRSGRMIKRKRLDDYEEDEFSFYGNTKRHKAESKSINLATKQPPEIKFVSKEIDSNDSSNDSSLKKVESVDEKKKQDNPQESSSESDFNSDSLDSLQDDQHENGDFEHKSLLDIGSEDRRERLKRKLEIKEKEKEKRKFEKLEQKRLDRMQKLRTLPVTSDVLRDIETEIIESLSLENANVSRCLHVLSKLDMLSISQKNLHEYTGIVRTLKKCRKFKADEQVRQKSETILKKFKILYLSGQTVEVIFLIIKTFEDLYK